MGGVKSRGIVHMLWRGMMTRKPLCTTDLNPSALDDTTITFSLVAEEGRQKLTGIDQLKPAAGVKNRKGLTP